MPIFVSYSRQDSAFVRTLHEALLSRDRQTWVDWEGIAPTADWMNEIRSAIDAAEAIVFVLSPESVASPVCAQELEHALAQNKRLIPMLRRTVDAATVPPALARLNWVHLRDSDDFESAIQTLLSAVDTDLDWVQAHTRLLVRSAEWDRRGRDGSLTLRGGDLQAAERWLTLGPTRSPLPTEVQTCFIIESRRQATRRRTVLLASGAVAMAVMAVLGTLFLLQREESARQEAIAVARRLAASSERLRVQPPEQPPQGSPVELSVQLAVIGLRRVLAVGEHSLEADLALRRALAVLPQPVVRLAQATDPTDFDAIAYGDHGEIVAASKGFATTAVWNPAGHLTTEGQRGKQSAGAAVLSPDGCCVAIVAPDGADRSVEVRDARTHALLAGPKELGQFGSVALAPGATHLLSMTVQVDPRTGTGREVTRLWELPAWREVLRMPLLYRASFSRDGAYLAALSADQPLVWSMARLRAGDAAPLVALTGAGPPTGPLLFSADGRHLAMNFGDNPTRVVVWAASDWQPVHVIEGGALIAVSPGGRLVAVEQRRDEAVMLRILDMADARDLAHIALSLREPAVAFDPSGRAVAVAAGKGIDVLRVRGHGADATRFIATPNTVALAFGDNDDRLSLLTRVGKGLATHYAVELRDLNGAPVSASVDLGPARLARFSPDGRWVVLGLGTELRVVDARNGHLRQRVLAEGNMESAALSPDALSLVAATDRRVLHLWQANSATPAASAPLPEPLTGPSQMLATDGRQVVAVTEVAQASRIGKAQSVHIWNAPALAPLESNALGRNRSGLAAGLCALSADGRLMAVHTAGSRVTVRETDSGRDIGSVDEAGERPLCTFSADGRILAVGSGTVRLWDIGSQAQIATLEDAGVSLDGSGSALRALAFSARGQRLAALQDDGTVTIWLLDTTRLLAQACLQLTQDISPPDWDRFVGSEPLRMACPQR